MRRTSALPSQLKCYRRLFTHGAEHYVCSRVPIRLIASPPIRSILCINPTEARGGTNAGSLGQLQHTDRVTADQSDCPEEPSASAPADEEPHIAISGMQAASGVAAAGAGAAENVLTHVAAAAVLLASIGVEAVGAVTASTWQTLSSIVELNVHRTWEGVCTLTSHALSHSASVVDVGIESAAAVAHEAVALASVTAETATILTGAARSDTPSAAWVDRGFQPVRLRTEGL